MDPKAFQPHTRYVVTLRDPDTGKPRPAQIYVYRLHPKFMIARITQDDGRLRKIPYEDVLKIVRTIPVPESLRYYVPEALLQERAWKDRDWMAQYATSPALGK